MMRIGIIGAGRVGCAFAFALADKGFEITGAYSKNPKSADYINNRLELDKHSDNNYPYHQSLATIPTVRELVKKSDVLLITVPDSEISSAAILIKESCTTSEIAGRVFMHCSGASTSKLLKPLEDAGAYTGSLHPAQTYPDRENSWKNMFNICFGFEGSVDAGKNASLIVERLNGTMLVLKADTKPLYHAAACVISNYTATLAYFAGDLLEAAGIDRETGMQAFSPLLMSTVRNILEMGSTRALTGPISRGDTVTVEEHLNAINGIMNDTKDKDKDKEKENDNSDASGLYKEMGRATTRLAVIKGSINEEKANELMELLKDK